MCGTLEARKTIYILLCKWIWSISNKQNNTKLSIWLVDCRSYPDIALYSNYTVMSQCTVTFPALNSGTLPILNHITKINRKYLRIKSNFKSPVLHGASHSPHHVLCVIHVEPNVPFYKSLPLILSNNQCLIQQIQITSIMKWAKPGISVTTRFYILLLKAVDGSGLKRTCLAFDKWRTLHDHDDTCLVFLVGWSGMSW
jgi:hypothetical protein